ncbi:MAG: YeeE/YedE thiosulfate transporter family protein [Ectobacillus sp.]
MLAKITLGLLCGILLGFVLQRGRFCVVGAYRDMILVRDNKMFIATLIVIAVQSIGVYSLLEFGVIKTEAGLFPWLATIIGGFIFGIGIVLAGGCATGTWYRAGEGLIGSWIALFAYMLSSAATKFGVLVPVQNSLNSYTFKDAHIYQTLGVSPWVLVIGFALIVAFLVGREMKKPKIVIPTMKPKKTGIAHILFEKRWNPFVTAVVVGLIAFIAWPLSAATGRYHGLGITTPSAKLLQFSVTGDVQLLDWATFMVIGILIGSYIAARGSGEFRWRLPDIKTIRNSAIGGLLMGFGASIAGGCTIGNGLVNTAIFTWQGWVAMIIMMLGTWTATYLFLMQKPKKAAGTSVGSKAANA